MSIVNVSCTDSGTHKMHYQSFNTRYGDHNFHASNPGSRYEPIYSARYDNDGRLVLDVVGKRDIVEIVQSHVESTNIYSILERFQNGEVDVLQKVQGFYDDITDMPTTFAEVLNLGIQAQQFFDSLPVEVKNDFNNSFSEFLVAAGSDDFLSRFEKFNHDSSTKPTVELKDPSPSTPKEGED